jgi:hypothetical protein
MVDRRDDNGPHILHAGTVLVTGASARAFSFSLRHVRMIRLTRTGYTPADVARGGVVLLQATAVVLA